jgi:phosphatidylserine synthase
MVTTTPGRWGPTHLLAIASSLATTVLYAVVGLEIVEVDGVAEVEPGPAVPLVIAAAAFAVLTTWLAIRPGVPAFVVGLALTLAVIVGYLVVAPSRSPSYEPWGLAIKAVEAILVVALVVLVTARRQR